MYRFAYWDSVHPLEQPFSRADCAFDSQTLESGIVSNHSSGAIALAMPPTSFVVHFSCRMVSGVT